MRFQQIYVRVSIVTDGGDSKVGMTNSGDHRLRNLLILLGVLATMLTVFAIITLAELWIASLLGFDVIARLSATYQSGDSAQFFFEAFGFVAFVVAQPVIFITVVVLLSVKLMPALAVASVTRYLSPL